MTVRAVPPDNDEFEVSVFGFRKGECIVVHVADGPWFVVDSMSVGEGSGKRSVADMYLHDMLHVDSLFGFFLTHWHDDHTGGAAQLLQAFATSLTIVGLPIAFSSRELISFVVDLLPNKQRVALVKDLLDVMSTLNKTSFQNVRRVILQDGTNLTLPGIGWSLEALSPSVDDARAQAATIASFLPGYQGPKPDHFDVNSGCAVLRLEKTGEVVMLSSDLDIGDTPRRGWQCVHNVHGARLPARIVKVGHHGSKTALHPPAWAAMAARGKPYGVLTPFPARGGALPKNQEIRELKLHCERVDLAGVSKDANQAGKVALKRTLFKTYHVTSSPASLERAAQVRYRWRVGDAQPRVELFLPAHQL